MVDNAVDIGPRLKLSLPVANSGERDDHEVRPLDAMVVHRLQERDALWWKENDSKLLTNIRE